jgi:hypothetical protein
MNTTRTIVVIISLTISTLSRFANAGTNTTDNLPIMSKDEAVRVLEKDPYNKLAMEALRVQGSLEYERKCKRRDEQVAQLDTDLLGIDTRVFGKPPRGGPWSEEEFQSLLKRQDKLRRQKSQPTGGGSGIPPPHR